MAQKVLDFSYIVESDSLASAQDTLALAQKAVAVGIIDQSVLNDLISLHPEVPNDLRHRYLLMRMQDCTDYAQELPLEYQRHLSSEPDGNASNPSPADVTLSHEHFSDLMVLLAKYTHKWREIGIALRFQPQDLDRINACPLLIPGAPNISHLTGLLESWLLRKFQHTLPPTLSNLKKALSSQIVGLGIMADEVQNLRSVILSCVHKTPEKQDLLHYSVTKMSVQAAEGQDNFIVSNNHGNKTRVQTDESASILFEVQVTSDIEPVNFEYYWLKDGEMLNDETANYSGASGSILCISQADTDMSGSKFCCKVTAFFSSSEQISAKSTPVTLKVNCPQLDQYRSPLESMYLEKPFVPVDAWPPIINKQYINLALAPMKITGSIVKVKRTTIRRKLDDCYKRMMEYKDLLEGLRSKHLLLIEGRPGSGKTTLVHKITRDWAVSPDGPMKLVLLVPLRKLNKANLDLSDILRTFRPLKINKLHLEEREGKGVCFIFDGLDEFSPADTKHSIIYQIISKLYLIQSTVIVASRPQAIQSLKTDVGLQPTMGFEVLGFRNTQIFRYFECYFARNPLKALHMRAYLLSHPNILHICYLPIHAAMIAYIFEVEGSIPQTETEIYEHFTRFTLMRGIFKDKVGHSFHVHKLHGVNKELFDEIGRLALDKTVANKQVLDEDKENSYFQGEALMNLEDISMGLLTVNLTSGLHGKRKIYNFPHLTFQEYLAAYHILKCLTHRDQLALIDEHGNKKHMREVWKFYCGLLKHHGNEGRFERLLCVNEGDILQHLEYAYESSTPSTCDLVVKHWNESLEFEHKQLTKSDLIALGFTMEHTSRSISLSLSHCEIHSESIDALSNQSANYSTVHTLKVNFIAINEREVENFKKFLFCFKSLKSLKLSAESMKSSSCLDSSPEAFTESCSSLKELTFTNIPIGPATFESIFQHCKELQKLTLIKSIKSVEVKVVANGLKTCSKLIELDIGSNLLQDKDAELIATGLEFCLSLRSINAEDNCMTGKGVSVLLKSLKQCSLELSSQQVIRGNSEVAADDILEGLKSSSNLQSLQFSGNVIYRDPKVFASRSESWRILNTLEFRECVNNEVASSIAEGLSHLSNLQVLKISGNANYINEDRVKKALTSGIGFCTKLKTLVFDRNSIGDNATLDLAKSLSKCQELEEVDLSFNMIGDKGAKALSSSFKAMPYLKSVNLYRNEIRGRAQDITSSLKDCSNLTSLNFGGNKIGKKGADGVSIHLRHWPHLQELNLCGVKYDEGMPEESNIGRTGCKKFAVNLKHCKQLRVLNLALNGIGDEGAKSIVSNLGECSNLTELALNGNKITEQNVRECQSEEFWRQIQIFHV